MTTINKKQQAGYFGKGIADAMVFMFVVVAIVSAIGGWALIEGAIWLFSHISLEWKP